MTMIVGENIYYIAFVVDKKYRVQMIFNRTRRLRFLSSMGDNFREIFNHQHQGCVMKFNTNSIVECN